MWGLHWWTPSNFFAIALIVYLTLCERLVVLALLVPLLVLSKETILPFLFLPFAKPGCGTGKWPRR